MDQYQNFSSLPAEQERQFVVFERTSQEASKKALLSGLIAGVGVFLLVMGVVFSQPAPENKHAESLDEELPAENAAPRAPAPTPAPAAAEEPAAPAEAEAADEAAAPAEGAEAPKPPPGATKAPPTALTK